jgi:molybdate transport system ATP-binding protein
MLRLAVSCQRNTFKLDAQFDAPTPGVTALFGRSGCGKSTLCNLLTGLLQPEHGRIALNDVVWFDSDRHIAVPAEQRGIGYVFQDARLFPHYSVRGNLLYGANGNVPGKSAICQFDDVVQLLGLESLLQRRPGALSGGEKQRVALGRALLSQPQLLVLDEPLASLDASRREEVLPFLERMRDHFAIPMVLVSHQFEEVLRLATHLVVMENGCVTAAGELSAVSTSDGLRSALGPDAFGAVVSGKVTRIDHSTKLADIAIGTQVIRVAAQSVVLDQPVRLHLLARDIILSVIEPTGLSVRNQLRGTITAITADGHGDLIEIDIGGIKLLSRITTSATQELSLGVGTSVWVLIKAVSVRPHATPELHAAAPAAYR